MKSYVDFISDIAVNPALLQELNEVAPFPSREQLEGWFTAKGTTVGTRSNSPRSAVPRRSICASSASSMTGRVCAGRQCSGRGLCRCSIQHRTSRS